MQLGPEVETLHVVDLLYASADHMEYVVTPEDGLLVKLPQEVDPRHAALFGMASVAMHSCRNADLRIGEEVLIVAEAARVYEALRDRTGELFGNRIHVGIEW